MRLKCENMQSSFEQRKVSWATLWNDSVGHQWGYLSEDGGITVCYYVAAGSAPDEETKHNGVLRGDHPSRNVCSTGQ